MRCKKVEVCQSLSFSKSLPYKNREEPFHAKQKAIESGKGNLVCRGQDMNQRAIIAHKHIGLRVNQ
jgi:hypothetical protein